MSEGTTITFKPNPAGAEAIARSVEMLEALSTIAEEGAADAAAAVPVASGDLQGGYHGEAGIEDGEAVGRVVGDDYKSGWYELGAENIDALAPMRRALEGMGLEVKPS